MPHICTRCNNVFDSGEDILRGCPVCGWRKFMFVKKGRHDAQHQAEQVINQSMGVKRPPKRLMKEQAVEKPEAKAKVETEALPASAKPVHSKIDDRVAEAPAQGKDTAMPEDDKLESIKITAPGTYELNLPSLFERDELIMAVKEGTYFIDLSSAFRKGKKD